MIFKLQNILKGYLKKIYENENQAEKALQLIGTKLEKYQPVADHRRSLSEKDSILITYGDTLISDEQSGLMSLRSFLMKYVGDGINSVHLLPIYPYSSDDGFSVIDYRKVRESVGSWEDVENLAKNYNLMLDAVINHCSVESDWFQKFLNEEKPFDEYFIKCDPNADYSTVTRPRALPLLTKFDARSGKIYVWTTFSTDQADLNYQSIDLMAEIVDLLMLYASKGARFIRLDAIGFLWKKMGTSCMHLPQTHAFIKMVKAILKVYFPQTRIITETNVPSAENLSYFGSNGDEADLVYQFPLPPLVMHTIISGNSKALMLWLNTLKVPSDKVTFFNFLSSHDGIGLRPVDGILTNKEQQTLIDATLRSGGKVSYKSNTDGSISPYELNISYLDALSSPDEKDDVRNDKFLAAETLLMSLQGVPGIYIHSLLGTRNDYYDETISGKPRKINRQQLELSYVEQQLTQNTNRRYIFDEMMRRLRIRRSEEAFSPSASQKVLFLNESTFSIERGEGQNHIFILINVTSKSEIVSVSGIAGIAKDLLTGEQMKQDVVLAPYQCRWIKSVQ